MATRRKTTTTSTTMTTAGARKATPAGRSAKSSPTRKSSRAATPEQASAAPPPPAAAAVEKRAQPQPIEPAPAKQAPVAEDTRFKRPDLIDAVADKTALKRGDAKIVLELVLQELGHALDRNEELVLPPLGKLMVKKRKPDADGPDVLTVKIRRPQTGPQAGGESPLADPGEDG